MRSQIVTASKRNIRFPPNVFTEHGALMAANILNSERAVDLFVAVRTGWFVLELPALVKEGWMRFADGVVRPRPV